MNGAWLPLSMDIHRLREGWQDDDTPSDKNGESHGGDDVAIFMDPKGTVVVNVDKVKKNTAK